MTPGAAPVSAAPVSAIPVVVVSAAPPAVANTTQFLPILGIGT